MCGGDRDRNCSVANNRDTCITFWNWSETAGSLFKGQQHCQQRKIPGVKHGSRGPLNATKREQQKDLWCRQASTTDHSFSGIDRPPQQTTPSQSSQDPGVSSRLMSPSLPTSFLWDGGGSYSFCLPQAPSVSMTRFSTQNRKSLQIKASI